MRLMLAYPCRSKHALGSGTEAGPSKQVKVDSGTCATQTHIL